MSNIKRYISYAEDMTKKTKFEIKKNNPGLVLNKLKDFKNKKENK